MQVVQAGNEILKLCTKCLGQFPLSNFYPHKTNKYSSICKRCCKEAASKRWEKNKEKYSISNKKWIKQNREKRKVYTRKQNLKRKFNISIEDYEKMLKDQNFKCKICKQQKDETFAVDHCHKTLKIRGLLCLKCNTGLGQFMDNIDFLKAAIIYLEE